MPRGSESTEQFTVRILGRRGSKDDDVEDMAYMCVCYRASELLNEYTPPLQADDWDYNDTIISQFCQLKMEVLASYAEVWNQMER